MVHVKEKEPIKSCGLCGTSRPISELTDDLGRYTCIDRQKCDGIVGACRREKEKAELMCEEPDEDLAELFCVARDGMKIYYDYNNRKLYAKHISRDEWCKCKPWQIEEVKRLLRGGRTSPEYSDYISDIIGI
jgi:hypothetical protein